MKRVGVLLLVVAAASGSAVAAFSAESPKALRASMLAAVRAKHSVHYVSTTVSRIRTQIVADVGTNRGIQRITYAKSGRTGHVTVIVVHRIAYVRGDAFTLHSYMEFTKSQAARYAGRWISIPPTLDSAVAAAVTFPSFVHELFLEGRYARVSGALDGRRVVGLRTTGRQQGLLVVATLFARPGTVLPVEENDLVPSKGYRSVTTLTHWNERVRVRAPAHATPVS